MEVNEYHRMREEEARSRDETAAYILAFHMYMGIESSIISRSEGEAAGLIEKARAIMEENKERFEEIKTRLDNLGGAAG